MDISTHMIALAANTDNLILFFPPIFILLFFFFITLAKASNRMLSRSRILDFLVFFLFQFILYWLCYYNCPDFFLLPPSTQHPYSLRQSPHHCSRSRIMHINSLTTLFPILYFTSFWLFCNYLFVLLNPRTSSPILPLPLPSDSLPVTTFLLLLQVSHYL